MAACRYVTATGDTGVLDEAVPFLEGRAGERRGGLLLRPAGDVRRDAPASTTTACARSEQGLRFGAHGLPLIGSGDWNDGMNLVGAEGRGESVWLGFFLYAVLTTFADLARRHGDAAFADRCLSEAATLQARLEEAGWDGAWYRRAYFDDGSPLGSSSNPECQIDSIAQSWSVLSGAADPARARTAMDAVDARLVRRGRRARPPARPAVRHLGARPRLHQGIRPGRARERRAVHPRGHLGGDGVCRTGRRPARVGRVAADQPARARIVAGGDRDLQGRALRGGGRRLRGAPRTSGAAGGPGTPGRPAWMYRLVVESLLGLRLEGDRLRIEPCLPADWSGFTVHYRYRETVYHIVVHQTPPATGDQRLSVDGQATGPQTWPASLGVLPGLEHRVEVRARGGTPTEPVPDRKPLQCLNGTDARRPAS